MKVVLTAPIPGVSTPSFPFGGATLTGLRIRFPPVRFEIIDEDEDIESREKLRVICGRMRAVAAACSRRVHETAFSFLRDR
jgi:hypothetical protein